MFSRGPTRRRQTREDARRLDTRVGVGTYEKLQSLAIALGVTIRDVIEAETEATWVEHMGALKSRKPLGLEPYLRGRDEVE